MFGPLLEVAVSKKCTPLWREAHLEVKTRASQNQGHQCHNKSIFLVQFCIPLRDGCTGRFYLPVFFAPQVRVMPSSHHALPNNSRLQHFFQFFISPLWGECAFLWSARGPTHHSAAGFLSAISVSTSVFIPHGLVHFFQELFEVITLLLTVLCL